MSAIKLGIIFSLCLPLSFVLAENISFQNIRVGGTGCPSDVTQIVLSPDQSSASLLFQTFESHVPTAPNPKGGGTNISQLNCNVFLDVKLPAGQKLDAIEVSYDMRGHTFLERGVNGSFKSFLISSNGLGTERNRGVQLIQEKNWFNTSVDQEEDFMISATKLLVVNSQCGSGADLDKVQLHFQHQLGSQILSGDNKTEGTITMDSSDIKGGMRLRATTSSCQIPRPQPPGRRNCRVIRVGNRAETICN